MYFRRGTLADPTTLGREKVLQEMHANCFLLVPLMPLCVANQQRLATNQREISNNNNIKKSSQPSINNYAASISSSSTSSSNFSLNSLDIRKDGYSLVFLIYLLKNFFNSFL